MKKFLMYTVISLMVLLQIALVVFLILLAQNVSQLNTKVNNLDQNQQVIVPDNDDSEDTDTANTPTEVTYQGDKYTSSEYGITFTYPSEYKTEECGIAGLYLVDPLITACAPEASGTHTFSGIALYAKETNLDLKDFHDEEISVWGNINAFPTNHKRDISYVVGEDTEALGTFGANGQITMVFFKHPTKDIGYAFAITEDDNYGFDDLEEVLGSVRFK